MQGFSGYRWKCYMANRAERWSWAQAKSQCEGLGGTLARIEDQSVTSLSFVSRHQSFIAIYPLVKSRMTHGLYARINGRCYFVRSLVFCKICPCCSVALLFYYEVFDDVCEKFSVDEFTNVLKINPVLASQWYKSTQSASSCMGQIRLTNTR